MGFIGVGGQGGGGTGDIVLASGTSGILSVNSATGPAISLVAGSGIESVVRDSNNIYLNASTSGVDGSRFLTHTQVSSSGYVQQAHLLASGYVRNIDFVASGYKTSAEITASGYTKQSDLVASGYIRNVDFIASGFETKSNVTTSGYVKHSELLTSGFLRHADLLSSGYVRTINGLSNAVTLVGSGGTNIWVDGQTIQINASGSSGSGVSLADVQADLHASGYIRNVNFVSSGYQTAAQITASGYLKASDRLYPVDARAVSGHIIPDVSGAWDIGSTTKFIKDLYVDRVFANSGVKVSGTQVVFSQIRAGSGIDSVVQVGNDIYINASGGTIQGGSGISTINGENGPAFTIASGPGISLVTTADTVTISADLTSSGFATFSALHGSGYATRSELTTSGYLRAADRMYPVDARAVSGHIIPNSSGAWNIGSSSAFINDAYINRIHVQSGLELSGVQTVYTEIKAGQGVSGIVSVGNDLYINTSGGSFDVYKTLVGAQTGTLLNTPTAGNPTIYIRTYISGVQYAIPAWAIP